MSKMVEIDDDKKLLPFFDRRMATELSGDSLGDEYKGAIFKIGGGNDKQGFPMKQGILTNNRVRLLFRKGMSCFRERRKGSRKRKSVRGCIVGPDLATLNLILVKKGDEEIPGLTDDQLPRRLGPKRANKIRKMFALTKDDDVRKFVVRREISVGKKKYKAPKIQRLVTPERLHRKKRTFNLKVSKLKQHRKEKEDYEKLCQKRKAEEKARKAAEVSKKKAAKKHE